MFDKNIMSHWRTFIHLKGVGRLGFKMLNVAKLMEVEFFLEVRLKRGWSFHWTCHERIIISLDMPNEG
jgi:hypothetical protein